MKERRKGQWYGQVRGGDRKDARVASCGQLARLKTVSGHLLGLMLEVIVSAAMISPTTCTVSHLNAKARRRLYRRDCMRPASDHERVRMRDGRPVGDVV